MVLVQKCCCGSSLSQGTVGTGIVTMIEAVVFLGFGSLMIAYPKPELFPMPEDNDIEHAHSDPEGFILGVGIYTVVLESMTLLATVCLFIAEKTKNRHLLLPWIIVRGITLKINILATLGLLIQKDYFLAGANGCWVVLMGYLFIVVYSYYQSDMERIVTDGQVLSPPPVFTPISQVPEVQYQPSYPMATAPPTSNYSGPTGYPTQNYFYNPQGQAYAMPPDGHQRLMLLTEHACDRRVKF